MSAFKWIHKILSPLLFFNMVTQLKGRASLVKIKAAQLYVQGVQKTRILFLGIFLVLLSLAILIGGLVLLHVGLFMYAPWSDNIKWTIACVLGLMEFSAAAALLIYLFSEETWARFTEVSKIMEYVVDTKSKKESDDEIKTNEKERKQGMDFYAATKHPRF
jgi:hypothetical protein